MLLAACLGVGAPAIGHAGSAPASTAGSLQFCDRSSPLTAREQDRLLRFASVARQELDASGAAVALIARSGLDLRRFDVRYSHAGVSLRASQHTTWSVRQLYYACDESRPRLYDQGLPGFLLGTENPAVGYASMVLLPPREAAALERAALDQALALRLLAGTYSANAYAFSLRYQNCNQWVMELLATAWGNLPVAVDAQAQRAQAQAWLETQAYAPEPLRVDSHLLMAAAHFVPLLHLDDHPEDDRFALQFRISLPASIEAFVRTRVPDAQRIELCHNERHIVVRHGWSPMGEGCEPQGGDRVLAFD